MKPADLWRPIPGYEGLYEVSASGLVWSVVSNCLMKPQRAQHGYQRVSLTRNSKKRPRLIHQLVLEAFVGPRPDGMETRHYPCRDRTNNNLLNLSWCTKAVNIQDQLDHGTHAQASKQNCPKCHGEYRTEADGTRYCPPCHLDAGRAWRARQRDALSVGLTRLFDIQEAR